MALKQKSAAEFFAENRTISGFDNAGKSLYTTMREVRNGGHGRGRLAHTSRAARATNNTTQLVENALDSAESIPALPCVEITLEEVSRARLNAQLGLQVHARHDAELFADFEARMRVD